jgi:hypothetical protein
MSFKNNGGFLQYSENIAACRLSPVAQKIVSELRDTEMSRALSMNPQLSSLAADVLISMNRSIKARAFAFTSDIERVERAVLKNGLHAQYAARNVGLSPSVLSKCLKSSNDAVALAALINKSTDQEACRSLGLDKIESLANVGGVLANSVVRSFEVVLANSWLRSDIARCSTNLRRGFTGLYDLTPEELDTIESGHYSHWKSHKSNPLRRGVNLLSMSTLELVSVGSVACDLLALDDQAMSKNDAFVMLTRRTTDVEPHILARVVERFGADVLPFDSTLSWARSSAAAWLMPIVGYSDEQNHNIPWAELQKAADVIGDDAGAWRLYSEMRHLWRDGLPELAQACVCLSDNATT